MTSMDGRRRRWTRRSAAPWLIAGLAAVVMSPAARNGWSELDEANYVKCLDVRSASPANLLHLLVSPQMGLHQPLVYLSHALDHALFGEDIHAFHAMSVAWYALGAALGTAVAGAVLRRVPGLSPGERTWATFVAGLLYAVHPVHVENVAWLADRKDVVGAPLAFAAFLVARRARAARGAPALGLHAAALGLVVAAMGAKTTMGAVAAAIALDAAFDPGAATTWAARLRRTLLHGGPVLALVAALLLYWGHEVFGTGQWFDRGSPPGFPQNAVYAARCAGRYVRHLVWPAGLIVTHLPGPGWGAFLRDLSPLAPVAVVVGLAARAGPTTRALAATAVAAFVLALGPMLSALTPFVCNRYLLLPSPWLAAAAAGGLVLARRRAPRATVAALAAALVALVASTARYLPDWHDDEALWTAALRAEPDNAFCRFAFVGVFLRRGRPVEAEARAAEAHAVAPHSVPAVLLHAQCLAALGREAEADALAEAARTDPRMDRPTQASAWLASMALARGDLARAELLARERFVATPREHAAMTLLGRIRLLRGDPAEALDLLERSLATFGTVEAALHAAYAAELLGRPEAAARHAEHAEWAGQTWETRLVLGRCALAAGDGPRALARLRSGRALLPAGHPAGALYAVELARAGALGEAHALLSALHAGGEAAPSVVYDLARVEALLGRREEAARHLAEAIAREPELRVRATGDPALSRL